MGGTIAIQDPRPNLIVALEYGQKTGLLKSDFYQSAEDDLVSIVIELTKMFHQPGLVNSYYVALHEAVGLISLVLVHYCGQDQAKAFAMISEYGLVELFANGWEFIAKLENTKPEQQKLLAALAYEPHVHWQGWSQYQHLAFRKQTQSRQVAFRRQLWTKCYKRNLTEQGYRTLLLSLRYLGVALPQPLDGQTLVVIIDAIQRQAVHRIEDIAKRLFGLDEEARKLLSVDMAGLLFPAINPIEVVAKTDVSAAMMALTTQFDFYIDASAMEHAVKTFQLEEQLKCLGKSELFERISAFASQPQLQTKAVEILIAKHSMVLSDWLDLLEIFTRWEDYFPWNEYLRTDVVALLQHKNIRQNVLREKLSVLVSEQGVPDEWLPIFWQLRQLLDRYQERALIGCLNFKQLNALFSSDTAGDLQLLALSVAELFIERQPSDWAAQLKPLIALLENQVSCYFEWPALKRAMQCKKAGKK
ncbi:MAG: hypothetical protein WCK11_01410 [Candidatus Falkowbacteria bacterium]